MDTKLKNSHRLGILIIILALLLASAGTIGLYPYMKTKAESYHNRSPSARSRRAVILETWQPRL